MWFPKLFLLRILVMKLADLKKRFGDEYPAAVTADGIRMPVRRESRFSRSYHSDHHPRMELQISRFMDGSASMSAIELKREWASWDEDIRLDFCQNSAWLHGQPDFPEMLRFIMQQGAPSDWSGVALSVASELPRDEAFGLLIRAFQNTAVGKTSNLIQAIAESKHPDAETTLRNHLAELWAHPALWANDDFLNWVAFDATTCIAHLIEFGAAPLDFSDHVSRLSEHVCPGNRDSCSNFLLKYYSWLKP
jgi:hypothetical protein